MKINNLDDLQIHAAEELELLRNGEISIEQAGATSKLCENLISSVKAKLAFAHMAKLTPKINFIGECGEERLKAIENAPIKD
jgi:hypothetical protein